MTAEMRHRLDRPENGFAFRGRRMEHAVMSGGVPPGGLRAGVGATRAGALPGGPRMQARCERCSPDGWKRADVALEFVTGKIIVLDVRTTNTLSASAATDPDSHLRAQESARRWRSTSRITATSIPSCRGLGWRRLRTVLWRAQAHRANAAAEAARPRLPWERFEWAAQMQRRVAVAMARTTAWIATRVPARPSPHGCLAGLGRRADLLAYRPGGALPVRRDRDEGLGGE